MQFGAINRAIQSQWLAASSIDTKTPLAGIDYIYTYIAKPTLTFDKAHHILFAMDEDNG